LREPLDRSSQERRAGLGAFIGEDLDVRARQSSRPYGIVDGLNVRRLAVVLLRVPGVCHWRSYLSSPS
jgi:hypothetical protein